MISEILSVGKENAKPGQWLADYYACGIPICASTAEPHGYYLAEDAADLQEYCNRLKHRGIEIFRTRQALIKTLKQMEAAPLPGKE